MTPWPWRSRAWLIVAVAVLVAACSSPAPTPSPSAIPTNDVAGLTGGTLRVGMDIADYESFQLDRDADPPRFNHAWDPSTTWATEPFELFRCCLLRTLMSYNGLSTSEGGAELQPDLAKEPPKISADGLTWTFTLRANLTYAPPMDTTPITSGDVIRALERVMRPDPFAHPDDPHPFGPYASYFEDVIAGAHDFRTGAVSSISGLEAPNPTTLVIHLVRPAGDLGARLAMPAAAPIPPGAADGHDAGYGRYLIASGPYMIDGSRELNPSLPRDQQPTLSGYVPGESLTLVRNPSWHRSDDSLRAAYVDSIKITQIADYDAELAALSSDQLDVSFSDDLDATDISRLRADSQVGSRIHVVPALASDWITMNLAVPPFDDVHVRRAVNLATNKRAVAGILHPEGRVLSHAIPDAFENGLLTEYNPYATADDGGSIDQAKAEMALSAYDSNGDGVCDAGACQAIYVPVRDDFPEQFVAAQTFASNLAPLGITLDLERVGVGTAFTYVNDPNNHGAVGFTVGWASDYLNASSWFAPLATSDFIASDAGANTSLVGATAEQLRGWGYTTPTVPSLDQEIASCVAQTGAAQFECWAQIDQFLMERVVPWVPLDNRQSSRLTSPSVTQFRFDASITMPALDQITLANP